jgi:hypothetical protein
MSKPRPTPPASVAAIAPLAGWIRAAPSQSLEEAAFRAGAALASLHPVVASDPVWQGLWRDRLALAAAETCVAISGRREGQGDLRDALHLTRAGDHPGPAGEMLLQWSRGVARPATPAHLARAIGDLTPEQIARWLEAEGSSPVARAAAVLEVVLDAAPRAETAALILAEAVLARSLGWGHLLPLLSLGLKPRDLRLRGADLRLACLRAVATGAAQALALAGDLARRAARLQAVQPQLRAKGAARAVALVLAQDALAPSAFGTFMSDRAARRLCDRLVQLGALRELTGRDSFRLYGL